MKLQTHPDTNQNFMFTQAFFLMVSFKKKKQHLFLAETNP